MKKRQNIDKLYQEKLRGVETTPPPGLWKDIEARLPQKKKQEQVVPLWYKIAGIAAAIALMISLGYNFLNTPSTQIEYVSAFDKNIYFPEGNAGLQPLTSKEFTQTMGNSLLLLQALKEETWKKTIAQQYREGIVSHTTSENSTITSNTSLTGKTKDTPFTGILKQPDSMILSGLENDFLKSGSPFITGPAAQDKAVAEENIQELPVQKNKEEYRNEEKENILPQNRLRVTTTAGAIYYGKAGGTGGNSIASRTTENTDTGGGESSMVYGINLAYEVSNKVTIRSGINKIDLSSKTQNMPRTSASNAFAEDYNVVSNAIILASPAPEPVNFSQNLGFIEVPVEIKYALINKTIGVNLIGGGSTLFLSENNVSLNAANQTTSFGEADNINDVSFSTNIGLGLDYNITPKFQLNLEPMFKYQFNTFSNSASLKPYYFGIYSGLSFKF